jgi:hypothetical protein
MSRRQPTNNFKKFQCCIIQEISTWDKTVLSPLEKYAMNKQVIWGIYAAALYILSTDEYFALQQWCEDTYGFSNRGVRGGTE